MARHLWCLSDVGENMVIFVLYFKPQGGYYYLINLSLGNAIAETVTAIMEIGRGILTRILALPFKRQWHYCISYIHKKK
jgi:hypothetical protein